MCVCVPCPCWWRLPTLQTCFAGYPAIYTKARNDDNILTVWSWGVCGGGFGRSGEFRSAPVKYNIVCCFLSLFLALAARVCQKCFGSNLRPALLVSLCVCLHCVRAIGAPNRMRCVCLHRCSRYMCTTRSTCVCDDGLSFGLGVCVPFFVGPEANQFRREQLGDNPIFLRDENVFVI